MDLSHQSAMKELKEKQTAHLDKQSQEAAAALQSVHESYAAKLSHMEETIRSLENTKVSFTERMQELDASRESKDTELTVATEKFNKLNAEKLQLESKHKIVTEDLQLLQQKFQKLTTESQQQSKENQEKLQELKTTLEASQVTHQKMMDEVIAKYEDALQEVTLESLMNELDRHHLQVQIEILLTYCEESNHLLGVDPLKYITSPNIANH